MKISNKVYDVLKYIAQIILPALGTAYAGMAAIWGWPASNKVVATVVIIDTFLGIALGISTQEYLSDLQKELRDPQKPPDGNDAAAKQD